MDLSNMLAQLSSQYQSEDDEFLNWLRQMAANQDLNQGKKTSLPQGMPGMTWPSRGGGPVFKTNPQGPVRNLIPPTTPYK